MGHFAKVVLCEMRYIYIYILLYSLNFLKSGKEKLLECEGLCLSREVLYSKRFRKVSSNFSNGISKLMRNDSKRKVKELSPEVAGIIVLIDCPYRFLIITVEYPRFPPQFHEEILARRFKAENFAPYEW